MDRETRKANLRKLQLPSNESKAINSKSCNGLRKTRSATGAISKYFNHIADDEIGKCLTQTAPSKESECVTSNVDNGPAIVQNDDHELDNPPQNGTTAVVDNATEQSTTAKRVKRTKLTAFVLKDANKFPVDMKTENRTPTDDFETPKKKVKTAPKLQRRKTAKATQASNTKSCANKRQPNIKSAFLRNEQIFAEITAQHCRAENFSADDVQLALAISKSEAESSSVLCIDSSEEMVVDLVENAQATECNSKTENVRNMLQRYGFRTAAREDYNSLAFAFLPGGKRRVKSKWANKFTPLTLRNPELQERKLIAKVDKLLCEQNRTKTLTAAGCQLETYTVLSSLLRCCQVNANENANKLTQLDSEPHIILEKYYVSDLFEVTHVQAGHLLKDWHAIQGRDLSPLKSSECAANELRLREAYAKLEEYYDGVRRELLELTEYDVDAGDKNKLTDAAVDGELNKLLELLSELPENRAESIHDTNYLSQHKTEKVNIDVKSNKAETPIKEPPDKKVKSSVDRVRRSLHSEALNKIEDVLSTQDDTCKSQNATNNISLSTRVQTSKSVNNETELSFGEQTELNLADKCSALPSSATSLSAGDSSLTKRSARTGSPDLFADSDSDIEAITEELPARDHVQRTDDSELALDEHGITTYEIYSSDEVKTSSANVNCGEEPNRYNEQEINSNPALVDLTQDETDICNLTPQSKSFQAPATELNSENVNEQHNFTLDNLAGNFNYDFDLGSPQTTPQKQNKTSTSSSTVSDEDYKRLCEKYLGPIEKYSLQRKSISMTQLSEHRNNSPAKMQQTSLTQATCTTDVLWKTPTKKRKSSPFKHFKYSSFNHSPKHTNQATQRSDTEASIDLTQSDRGDDSEDDGCIMLSDDEINYSIWKANKSINVRTENESASAGSSSPLKKCCTLNKHEFSILDILDDAQIGVVSTKSKTRARTVSGMSTSSTDENSASSFGKYPPVANDFSLYSDLLGTSNVNERSRERAEFGILDNISEPFSETPPLLKTSMKFNLNGVSTVSNCNDFSLLDSPSENAIFMKRYSSGQGSTKKLKSLLQEVQKKSEMPAFDAFDDFDEFDQLIYGAPNAVKCSTTSINQQTPAGLEQLLTAELSFCNSDVFESQKGATHLPHTPKKTTSDAPVEYEIAGRKYVARVVGTPKPDFTHQSDAEILKQLYGYGIKPLKRKEAVKMLEYIYNQTHPIMLDEQLSRHGSTVSNSEVEQPEAPSQANAKQQVYTDSGADTLPNKLELCDCAGDVLQRFSLELQFEMEDEMYIFQTNISKKLQQPLLPLHVAWYNLVCASTKLHETILTYQPIDLQEIYQFLKHLGYRYDPKDMKTFFDRRCIIFRYDLTPPSKQGDRHVRKRKTRKKTKR